MSDHGGGAGAYRNWFYRQARGKTEYMTHRTLSQSSKTRKAEPMGRNRKPAPTTFDFPAFVRNRIAEQSHKEEIPVNEETVFELRLFHQPNGWCVDLQVVYNTDSEVLFEEWIDEVPTDELQRKLEEDTDLAVGRFVERTEDLLKLIKKRFNV